MVPGSLFDTRQTLSSGPGPDASKQLAARDGYLSAVSQLKSISMNFVNFRRFSWLFNDFRLFQFWGEELMLARVGIHFREGERGGEGKHPCSH